MLRLYTVALATALLAAGAADAQVTTKTFSLKPEAKFLSCFAASPAVPPIATVSVSRSGQRDRLILTADHLKPNARFDVFTVQRTNLLPTGAVDPSFTNFGLAWYQTDLISDAAGHASTTLFTILIDQIFGFDPDVALAPTNTFHVGFWFDNPLKAAPCGFNAAMPTPFNGEHKAGPAAMMSVPDTTTGLGPLCLNPSATKPSGCND